MKNWSPAFLLALLVFVPFETLTLVIWLPVLLLWLQTLFMLTWQHARTAQLPIRERYGIYIAFVLIILSSLWVYHAQYWAQQQSRIHAQQIAQRCWNEGMCPEKLDSFDCRPDSGNCYRIYRSLGVTPYLQIYLPSRDLQEFRLILRQGEQHFTFYGGVNLVFKESVES